jgi:GDPmannose 4,6-dehydratase
MWLMLQQPEPDDYVIATGVQHSVRDFVDAAAAVLGMAIEWNGSGADESGTWNGRAVVRIDPRYHRPAEVETLLGDATKAREKLRWTPRTRFADLVREMVESDLESAERDALIRHHGFTSYERKE